jgi:uncharacterized protein YoxC
LLIATFTWGDLWRLALAVFLLSVGLSLGYLFLRLGETVGRLSSLVKGVEREALPVISKVGGSVDRVNGQLDKVDLMTDSAVDAVESVDTAIRAVSMAITRPIQKVTGLAAGISYGAAEFKTRHDWRAAVQAGKEAAARRERELAEELRDAERTPG